MAAIPAEAADLLKRQNFVIVSTRDPDGRIHSSCKGIVRIEQDKGRIYLLDLYLKRTFRNLQKDPHISISAADEHSFSGYCFKGKGRIIPRSEAHPAIVREWEEKITQRISQRLVRNIRGEKGHAGHPEARLPAPQYIIVMDVEEIVDLTPPLLKQ